MPVDHGTDPHRIKNPSQMWRSSPMHREPLSSSMSQQHQVAVAFSDHDSQQEGYR